MNSKLSGKSRPEGASSRSKRHRYLLWIVAVALLHFSCDYLKKINQPVEYSTAIFKGVVWDSVFNRPVKGAVVTIENGDVPPCTSDANGAFVFERKVRTGSHRFSIVKSGFNECTGEVTVTLNPDNYIVNITRAEAAPSIENFIGDLNFVKCIDDTVIFRYRAWDSTGGITGIKIDPGNGSNLSKAYGNGTFFVNDSVKFVYDTAGTFTATLTVIGDKSDESTLKTQVMIPQNHRPVFTSIEMPPDGFLNGEWGYLQIYANDPDSSPAKNFDFLTIDWGDVDYNKIDLSTASNGEPQWHQYNFAGIVRVTIKVRLNDKLGATADTTLSVLVKTHQAPLLDNSIVFDPPMPGPGDDSIHIGVKVLQIDSSYVSEIDWVVNPDDTASVLTARKNYNSTTGNITSVIGNVFANSFSTAKLKAINEVTIMVYDRMKKSSSIRGTFLVAGKPN
jgi:hypothetical protein